MRHPVHRRLSSSREDHPGSHRIDPALIVLVGAGTGAWGTAA